MSIRFPLIILILFLSFSGFTQFECGVSDEEVFQLKNSVLPYYLKGGEVDTIEVEVICIYPNESRVPADFTDEKIKQELIDLDTIFNPLGIDFELCQDVVWYFDEELSKDYYYIHNNRPYFDSRFHTPGKLTIYIGATVMPGAAAYASASSHVSLYGHTAFTVAVIAHEMGHMFGLPHTHATMGGKEFVDGSNCAIAGDQICDTPADPKLLGFVNENCEYTGSHKDPNGDSYNPDESNYMSYSRSSCQSTFTEEQSAIMKAVAQGKIEDEHYASCNQEVAFCLTESVINRCQGFLSDGSGSSQYQNNTHCEFLLTSSEPNAKMKLYFNMFETELDNDVLYVYDGEDASAPLLLMHSGNSLPEDVIASGDKIFLVFETNESISGEGWLLNYDCFEGSDLEVLLPYKAFYEFDGPSAIINAKITNHGNQPNNECVSAIRINHFSSPLNGADTTLYVTTPVVQPGDTIVVSTTFDLCTFEKRTNNAGKYNLDYTVDRWNANDEYVYVNNINYNNSLEGDPICAACTEYEEFTLCVDSLEDGSGDLLNYEANQNCSWNISSSYGEGLFIYFDFVNINLFSADRGDSIVLYDGTDDTAAVLAVIKSSGFTDTLYTTGNDAFIRFVTDEETNDKGWKLMYECINPALADLNLITPNPSECFTLLGDELVINYDVKNDGLVKSISCEARLRVYHDNYLQNKADTFIYMDIPAIEAGEKITLSKTFKICDLEALTQDAGTYFVDIEINHLQTSNEEVYHNNVVEGLATGIIDPICSSCILYDEFTECSMMWADGSSVSQTYEGNLDCTWNINTIIGTKPLLHLVEPDARALAAGDSILVYDGLSTNGLLLKAFTSENFQDSIILPTHQATVRFITNEDDHGLGWLLTYNCDYVTGISTISNTKTKVWPNPSFTGVFNITNPTKEKWQLFNYLGQELLELKGTETNVAITTRGVYYLKIGNETIKLVY